MKTKLLGAVIVALLFSLPALIAQSRNGKTSRRSQTPASRESQPPPPDVPLPATASQPRAGTVIPPEAGYVVMPDSARAGTIAPIPIYSDPRDRGYWELYDREKRVTLTGRVRRVVWADPNSYIYLTADGAVWVVESGFGHFRQSSVTPAVHVDETITVLGYFPKKEPAGELPAEISPSLTTFLKADHLIRAGEITTAFGQKLVMGWPPSEAEIAQSLKCFTFAC
jgi:hypothetical protein